MPCSKPAARLDAVSFLQGFATQSVRAASQIGCSSCSNQMSYIERLGLTASGSLEQACRDLTRMTGKLTQEQYADLIVALKNQIGGNFSRASSGADVVRVVNSRCPFGEAVREAPELCRMTSSVFGGIGARNFGYAKVELRKRIAVGDARCEVLVYLDRAAAAAREGDEYRLERETLVSESAAFDVAIRVEKKMQQAWCAAPAQRSVGADAMPMIVARSPAMCRALEAVEVVGPTSAAVLISGETGVGKEVIARALHAMSPRSASAFVAVNCGAIPESLIESQLFGHEKGAFTGAYQVHHGFFERAEKGTLFLDEVNSLPLAAQARLLRVLQDGKFERVGGKHALRSDTRVVAASNGNLEQMVHEGAFRRDLYYRLNVVPIHLPPLRERRDDLAALSEHILRRLAVRYGGRPKLLSEQAWLQVMTHAWPGNVRELENALERSYLLCRQQVIHQVLLDSESHADAPDSGAAPALRKVKRQAVLELEDRIIREALNRSGGNVSAAARDLGISPRAVHQKLRMHKIDPGTFRQRGRDGAAPA
jgi:Nif-specific regulatory protein/two-component system response regulator AtoC